MVERKTMRGVPLDIEVLMAEHEDELAVGNASFNARGDLVGPGGKIIKTRQEVTQAYYENNPNAVQTNQSIKEPVGQTKQSTLKPDVIQDDWVEPEPTEVTHPQEPQVTEQQKRAPTPQRKKQAQTRKPTESEA